MEVLAPVGDWDTLAAAIKAGANSVYFGIKGLNMRSGSARNFDISDLKEVVSKCHESKVKAYLALNTLVYNHELPRVEKILDACKEAELDAIICTDFGVIELAKEKGIEVHISTQASISNVKSAKFYAKFSPRLVLARECTLDQIKDIKKEVGVEIEVFCHGSMCVAESGRCFMSQFHNRISANRGQCLHECRRAYKIVDEEEPQREFKLDNQYIMSPKDLCSLPILDKFKEAGVDVIKIEGRAKGPEYVFNVTKVYREAVDSLEKGEFNDELVEKLLGELKKVYNRGFSTGFLLGTPTNDSWAGLYGSVAGKTKERLGKIVNYYSNKGIAEVSLENVELAVGDIVMVSGPTTGYVETKVESIHTDDGEVEKVKKAIVCFPVPEKVRKNDIVFKLHIQEQSEIDKYDTHEPFKTTKLQSKSRKK